MREVVESEEGQRRIEKVRRLGRIAEELNTNTTLLALAWCLRRPQVSTVILGASRVEQVHENLKALDVLPQLTGDVLAAIEDVLGNQPQPVAIS
jgi:aryl-alcohol dehydrogenase-like predicted oxidoreductase